MSREIQRGNAMKPETQLCDGLGAGQADGFLHREEERTKRQQAGEVA